MIFPVFTAAVWITTVDQATLGVKGSRVVQSGIKDKDPSNADGTGFRELSSPSHVTQVMNHFSNVPSVPDTRFQSISKTSLTVYTMDSNYSTST